MRFALVAKPICFAVKVEKRANAATPTTGPIKAKSNCNPRCRESSIWEKNQAQTKIASGPDKLKLTCCRAVSKSMLPAVNTMEGSSNAKYNNGSSGPFTRRRVTIEKMNRKTTAYLPHSQNIGARVMRHNTSAPVIYAPTYATRSGRFLNVVHHRPTPNVVRAWATPTSGYSRIANASGTCATRKTT